MKNPLFLPHWTSCYVELEVVVDAVESRFGEGIALGERQLETTRLARNPARQAHTHE